MNFELMAESFPQIMGGVPETLTLVFSSLAIGFVLAVVVAQARLSKQLWLSKLAYGYVYVFRSTPLLVQIFLIYYGSGQFRAELQTWGLWGLFREPHFCAILALVLNTGAYTSEIIRGGIQSVPLGQLEAGRAVGMSRLQLFRRITFPIAIRQALPAYGNEIMLMVKSSSLASTITILEVTGIAKKIIAATFAPVEVFIIAGGDLPDDELRRHPGHLGRGALAHAALAAGPGEGRQGRRRRGDGPLNTGAGRRIGGLS